MRAVVERCVDFLTEIGTEVQYPLARVQEAKAPPYVSALEEIAGRVGIASAVRSFRTKIYDAIAGAYPSLADECQRKLTRRGQ